MNRKAILRKLPTTILQESTNVSMNETLINLLQQNRTEKVGGGAWVGIGKTIPSGTVVNEETPQEEQQPDLSRQCNNLAESSNEEEDDGTYCKTCKNREMRRLG